MGVEYYLVKPDKKEVFELGRHIQPFEGIAKYPAKAAWTKYDYYKEFLLDMIETNGSIIGECYTYEDVVDFAYQLWEWMDDKVYLATDCDNEQEWTDFKVTGSVYSYCEDHVPIKDAVEELIDKYIPEYKGKDALSDLERYLNDTTKR